MDNANPTIVNVSDLPTRRRRSPGRSSKADDGSIFALLDLKSTLLDHYDESESDLDSEEDLSVEPIDEQEIYGTLDPSQRMIAVPSHASSLDNPIHHPSSDVPH